MGVATKTTSSLALAQGCARMRAHVSAAPAVSVKEGCYEVSEEEPDPRGTRKNELTEI